MHPLVESYLHALENAARELPRDERKELVAEISEHIEAALAADASEAAIRNVLDQLGSPRDIVAAAGGQPATVRRGAREAFALVLLATGLPPIIGWLIGFALLLWSPLWSARQKLLAVLVWPGGLFGALVVLLLPGSTTVCPGAGLASKTVACASSHTGPPGWLVPFVAVVLVAAPLIVAVHLWREAGRRSTS
jgi:hypothetical protein